MRHRHMLLSFVCGLELTLVLLMALSLSSKVVYAASKDWFAETGGAGTSCTQADPCDLQTALSQANDGDTIYIAQGNYTSSGTAVLNVTQSITLYGGWDGATSGAVVRDPAAYTTTLDGQDARRVVHISGDVTPTLEGLWITNGAINSQNGGGIYSDSAHPIISGCHIFDNVADFGGGGVAFTSGSDNATLTGNYIYRNEGNSGGGVYVDSSSQVTLAENWVFSNTAQSFNGGGLYLYKSSTPTLANNLVYSNTADGNGGGIYIDSSDNPVLTNNQISHNATITPGQSGGGVYITGSNIPRITGNQIFSNTTTNGGGLMLYASDNAKLMNNFIHNNVAEGNGGGIFIWGSSNAEVTNNLVFENQSSGIGSGINAFNSTIRLLHTTLSRNSSGGGKGLYVVGGSVVSATNTILVSHTVGINVSSGNTATLEATLWGDGAWANGDDWTGSGTIITGTSNIRQAPLFVNPALGDYHLQSGSPAVNAGVDAGIATDIDDEARWGLPDLGADEYIGYIYLPLVLRNS